MQNSAKQAAAFNHTTLAPSCILGCTDQMVHRPPSTKPHQAHATTPPVLQPCIRSWCFQTPPHTPRSRSLASCSDQTPLFKYHENLALNHSTISLTAHHYDRRFYYSPCIRQPQASASNHHTPLITMVRNHGKFSRPCNITGRGCTRSARKKRSIKPGVADKVRVVVNRGIPSGPMFGWVMKPLCVCICLICETRLVKLAMRCIATLENVCC